MAGAPSKALRLWTVSHRSAAKGWLGIPLNNPLHGRLTREQGHGHQAYLGEVLLPPWSWLFKEKAKVKDNKAKTRVLMKVRRASREASGALPVRSGSPGEVSPWLEKDLRPRKSRPPPLHSSPSSLPFDSPRYLPSSPIVKETLTAKEDW